MEACAKVSQWQIKFRCKDKDKKCFMEFHPCVEQAETDLDGDDGGAEGGKQFQSQRREKRDPQNAQCCVAELVADVFDIFCMCLGLTE